VHPDDIGHVEDAVRHAAETLNPMTIEFRIIRPDGSMRWIASQARAYDDGANSVHRLIGVNIDITERKRAEEALREADRRKDEFLAMLGHELRNPLGIISTSVQLLRRKGPADSILVDLREMILRQTEHMSRMLDDLLDVSRITRGQISLKKEYCDFAKIVRQMAVDQRAAFDESGVHLALELPDQPLWVRGDPTRLAQIVGNLLYNANKFTDCGGTVTVRLGEMAGSAVLSVKDTGIGIEPAMVGQIFEPFIQADRSIDRSRGGLGLGLALVKGLVKLHGGEVGAQSEGLGRGSEFIIRLPLEASAALPVAKPSEATDQKGAPGCRVLIVEDNLLAARTMQMYLETAGHDVEVAHTGPAGIESARRFHPNVVLCDIGLPGFDGYDVARSLRRETELHEIGLIAISGYGQDDDQRQAREAGFDLHLSKPVDLEQIDGILATFQRTGKIC
jgi:signal transduction histidine kinase/ActR/RegA family two-component response regulator